MSAQISKETIGFLKQLKKNNNREWFNANKKKFEEAQLDFSKFVAELIAGVTSFDKSVAHLTPKDCLFRIYRDTRFSKDKRPYKTNFGAAISEGKKSGGMAGYYLHLEPGAAFLAGGVHMPEPDRLKGIREMISDEGKKFLSIVNHKDFKKNFTLWGDKLKTAPKGFDKEHPMMEYLQYKDFVVKYDIKDADITSAGFAKQCVQIFRAMQPFNDFVNTPVS